MKPIQDTKTYYQDKRDLITRHIRKGDRVLDVGFFGQGVDVDNPHWPHSIIKSITDDVYGVDLDYTLLLPTDRYLKASAEQFDFPVKFDVIFAGDLIEHLSNLGGFLDSCARNLKEDGVLLLTTPNAFNLFNLTEKLSKREPTVNSDHTCYFNSKTLSKLLEKNKFEATEISFLYTLHVEYRESLKKRVLNVFYWFLSRFTNKFVETLVVVAKKTTV